MPPASLHRRGPSGDSRGPKEPFITVYAHVMSPEETFEGICLEFGASVDSVRRANRIWSSSLIFRTRRILVIPLEDCAGHMATYCKLESPETNVQTLQEVDSRRGRPEVDVGEFLGDTFGTETFVASSNTFVNSGIGSSTIPDDIPDIFTALRDIGTSSVGPKPDPNSTERYADYKQIETVPLAQLTERLCRDLLRDLGGPDEATEAEFTSRELPVRVLGYRKLDSSVTEQPERFVLVAQIPERFIRGFRRRSLSGGPKPKRSTIFSAETHLAVFNPSIEPAKAMAEASVDAAVEAEQLGRVNAEAETEEPLVGLSSELERKFRDAYHRVYDSFVDMIRSRYGRSVGSERIELQEHPKNK